MSTALSFSDSTDVAEATRHATSLETEKNGESVDSNPPPGTKPNPFRDRQLERTTTATRRSPGCLAMVVFVSTLPNLPDESSSAFTTGIVKLHLLTLHGWSHSMSTPGIDGPHHSSQVS
jgi:hypothetical protein